MYLVGMRRLPEKGASEQSERTTRQPSNIPLNIFDRIVYCIGSAQKRVHKEHSLDTPLASSQRTILGLTIHPDTILALV